MNSGRWGPSKAIGLLDLRHNPISYEIFFLSYPFQYHNALQKAQTRYRLLTDKS